MDISILACDGHLNLSLGSSLPPICFGLTPAWPTNHLFCLTSVNYAVLAKVSTFRLVRGCKLFAHQSPRPSWGPQVPAIHLNVISKDQCTWNKIQYTYHIHAYFQILTLWTSSCRFWTCSKMSTLPFIRNNDKN